MPNKPSKPAQKYDPKKAGLDFPKVGGFDSPTLRRVVFNQPMTERDLKDFKTKAGRKKFYKDRMGDKVFGINERKMQEAHHKHRMKKKK